MQKANRKNGLELGILYANVITMTIYITGYTALEYWRWQMLTGTCLDRSAKTKATRLGRCSETPNEIKEFCNSFHQDSRPIHLACANKRNYPNIHFHLITQELPPNSLFKINSKVYVASPELALAQVANAESFIDTLLIMFEACGHYTLDNSDTRGFRQRPPLTSIKKLHAFTKHAKSIYGIKALCKAAHNAIDGSASPRETAAALLLTLPSRYGGYGLEKPKLNEKIELSKSQQHALGKQFLRVDMLWEKAHIALEYDSDAFHCDSKDISRDSRRRNMLELHNINVLTLTRDELNSIDDTERIAKLIAHGLGKRLRIRSDGFVQARYALRNKVLSSHH